MNLKEMVTKTLNALARARQSPPSEAFSAEPACRLATETISTSLRELLLTHPQFSWLVTDADVRAQVSISDNNPYSIYNRFHASLDSADKETALVLTITRKEKVS